jgi:HD-like signal output (HDOD) protein
VPNSHIIDFLSARRSAAPRPLIQSAGEILPDVPVLPETLLVMELQSSAESIDLTGFTEAVLSDVGATIRILCLAGEEYGDSEDRPLRIEDCIADLGVEACMRAALHGMRTGSEDHDDIIEMWGHSTEIARQCQILADTRFEINPSQAYLVGLLHDIGALPFVLGWNRDDLTGDYALSALKMAARWSFPAFLTDYFYEAYLPGKNRDWTDMIEAAHHAASRTWAWCPLNETTVQKHAHVGG